MVPSDIERIHTKNVLVCSDLSSSVIPIKAENLIHVLPIKDTNPKIYERNELEKLEKLEKFNIEHFIRSHEKAMFNVNIKIMQKKENLLYLKIKKFVLGFMFFYITIYFFSSTTLLIANSQGQEKIEENFSGGFHLLDFLGSFIFALVEASALVISGMMSIGDLRFFTAMFNVGCTLVALILYSFNPEYWEVPAHWCEYAAQVCLTLADFFFVLHNFKDKENILYRYRFCEIIIISLLTLASILKLFVFGSIIVLSDHPDHDAHYFEFIGEMCNAMFAFTFTYFLFKENKLVEISEYKDLCNESEIQNNIRMNNYF
jgi:hypothetical protein